MFTHNQVRQLYVANALQTAASGMTTAGDIMVNEQNGDFYFTYVNPDGEILRSDLINKEKVMHMTSTPAALQAYTSKAKVIMLSADVIDSDTSNPVAGEDYILNIKAMNPLYQSELNPRWKTSAVHTTTSTTPSDFYKTLAKSIYANTSRDQFCNFKVYVTTAASASAVTSDNITEVTDSADLDSITAKGVVIDEALPMFYDVFGDIVYVSGEETEWAEVTDITGFTTIGNGAKIVDMEKFYHGERGDIYREAAWPTNWPNQMVANASTVYDTIDIHYYWNGANHAVQKSEKDITIACPTGVTSSIVTAIKGVFDKAADWTYSATGVATVFPQEYVSAS